MHVLRVCHVHAGCMLFGESTDYQTAGRLLSMCIDTGTTFFDTAEMYVHLYVLSHVLSCSFSSFLHPRSLVAASSSLFSSLVPARLPP